MRNMDILQRMPFLAQDAVFKRLSEIDDPASLPKEERRQYDEILKQYRDTIAVMHGQYLEGYAVGYVEGLAKVRAAGLPEELSEGFVEGYVKEIKDLVWRMRSKGLSKEEIAELTKLPPEVVKFL